MQQVARKRGQQKEKLMTQAGSSPGDSHPRQSHFRDAYAWFSLFGCWRTQVLTSWDVACVCCFVRGRGDGRSSLFLCVYIVLYLLPRGRGQRLWHGWVGALPLYRLTAARIGSLDPTILRAVLTIHVAPVLCYAAGVHMDGAVAENGFSGAPEEDDPW